MFMLIIVYLYTSLTFFYIQDEMYSYDVNGYDSDVVGENFCGSMAHCFTNMLDDGLRNGGGIGDATMPVHFNDLPTKYSLKLIHDATFQVAVNIICLNIIFGIIVNSFAELRDAKARGDEDMHNYCYICQIQKMVFEKYTSGGFN